MRLISLCIFVSLAMIEAPAAANAADNAPAEAAHDSYRLDSGDKLQITVFNEPTLSGTYTVTSSGAVSMPLVGDVPAAGLSVEELQQKLTTEFAHFVKQPRISVEPASYRPYYILGEVNKPGEYPYSVGLMAQQAVAAAGGYTYRANRGTVFVTRADGRHEQRMRIKDRRILVMPGDTIRIGERFF